MATRPSSAWLTNGSEPVESFRGIILGLAAASDSGARLDGAVSHTSVKAVGGAECDEQN